MHSGPVRSISEKGPSSRLPASFKKAASFNDRQTGGEEIHARGWSWHAAWGDWVARSRRFCSRLYSRHSPRLERPRRMTPMRPPARGKPRISRRTPSGVPRSPTSYGSATPHPAVSPPPRAGPGS